MEVAEIKYLNMNNGKRMNDGMRHIAAKITQDGVNGCWIDEIVTNLFFYVDKDEGIYFVNNMNHQEEMCSPFVMNIKKNYSSILATDIIELFKKPIYNCTKK